MRPRYSLTLTLTLALPLVVSCRTTADSGEEPVQAWTCSPRVELSTLWTHLSRKYDADGDGSVTASEYDRGEVRFANYDRDGDGVLQSDDFPTDTHFNGFSYMLVRDADADEDGAVTPDEWRAHCAAFDVDGDGRIERDEVEATMGRWTDDWRLFLLSFDQDGDADFDEADLALTFRDQDFNGDGALEGKELEGWTRTAPRGEGEPPAPGEAAPDFELAYAGEPTRTFRLAADRGGRPVALIFGSYT